MLLTNVHITGREGSFDIGLQGGKIQSVESHAKAGGWNMQGALAFPGLINSHDHLDFNCFSYTANRKYTSYREWGRDIQQNNREAIDRILRIPAQLRTRWGMYKNLINGVTTVVHHGERVSAGNYPVHVFQHCYNLHSVAFERYWKWKLNNPLRSATTVAMHAGEGTDEETEHELVQLLRWNILKRKIVAVHGVCMNETTAKGFHALTWCPATNFFLLGKTAEVGKLKKQLPIIFGTDSTLTASWNIWEQLQEARATGLLTGEELFDSVTRIPAEVWGMKDKGRIEAGYAADIIVAQTTSALSCEPGQLLLVIQDGIVRLIDASLGQVLAGTDTALYSSCHIQGVKKYVWGDVADLISEIHKWCPGIDLPVTI